MNFTNHFSGTIVALACLSAGAGLAQAQPSLRVDPQTLVFDSVGNRTMYVELDWMEAPDHSHKPSQEVIDRIVRTFAAEGYSIVIELGNAIPHQDNLNVTGSPSGSPDIQAIRNQHFEHRFDPRYFYSIWAHQYNGTGSSGVADLPGRIHLVTLGSFPGQVGTFAHQVGTFIHEFGHNLGQRHGGADHANYKPNYVSVMNYHFQLSGIGPVLQARGLANSSQGFNDFGYSHGALLALNESSLDERIGIGLGRAVDWNCDGDATDVNLARDLQENGNWCAPGTALSVLEDFDNWTSINSFISAGAFSPASLEMVPDEPSETCIDWEQHQAMLRELGPLAEPAPPPPPLAGMAPAGVDPGPGFMIYNDGQADLMVSAINKVTAADWIAWTPPPPFVIPPGGSRLVVVTVDFTRAPVGSSTRELSIVSNDPDGSTNVSVVVVNQATTANLYLRQQESADPASITCPLTYTLEVGNRGPTGATGVLVTNELPAGVTFQSATSSQGTITTNGSIIVADLGTISFSSNATVSITVNPMTQTLLTNRAQISAAQVDPDPTDNVAIETTTAFVDTTGPLLLTAAAEPDGHSVMLTFSEPVTATALNLAHYSVTDGATNVVPVAGVQTGPLPNQARLQMNLLTRSGPFWVRATNITDCIGNSMPPTGGETYINLPVFTLVSAGASWKYLDNGSDQGVAWRASIFDDSNWSSGPAQLGYGDGDENTEVSFGGNPNAKFITTYFRKSFVVEDATKLTNAVVYLLRDDGAAVYLNGTPVVRSNLVANATSTTPATASISDEEENTFFASRINSALLQTGTNVLAVEVHQSSGTSSDVSFDLGLTAEARLAAVRPAFIQHPESQLALVGDTVAFNVVLTGSPPLKYLWRFNNIFLPPGQVETPTLTLTNVQLTNAGSYTVIVSNAQTLPVLSGRAALSVMADGDGDRMGDLWEDMHGFKKDDPSDAAGDADGDGMSNREEFQAGTDPHAPGSFLKIDSITALTNSIRLGFTAVSNRNYTVLYRDHPAAPWQRLTNCLGRTTNRIETILDFQGTNSGRWYRLVTPKEP